MDSKVAPLVGVKAGPDDGLADGEFVAYASVFGNVDSYGDVVMPGAFVGSLGDWKASGNTLPVLWGHDMHDPFSNIGGALELSEDEHGLKVHAALDLDNPKAKQVYRLLKGRRVNQMSFAYDVIDSSFGDRDGEPVRELKQLKLYEVSVVPIGANQETEILAVKATADALAAGLKEGRVLAQKHIDSLRDAQEAIGRVIDAAVGESDQEKASEPTSAKSDEERPDGEAKSDEEPGQVSSVDDWQAQINIRARKGMES